MNDVHNRTAAPPRITSNRVDDPWEKTHALQELHAYRRPIDSLLLQIVKSVMREFLPEPPADSTILEIACGDGQLRSWTPRALRKQLIHTDLSNALLKQLQSRYPDARVRQADARELPFDDASQAAVFGLCAYDSLHGQQRIRDEIRRVLVPGGTFIHFLDMQANPEFLFEELVNSGRIPLPNFLENDELMQSLSEEMRERLPRTNTLDDFLVIERAVLLSMVEFLTRTGNPMSADLTPFARNFDPENFDRLRSTGAFMSMLSDGKQLAVVSRVLLSLCLGFGNGQHRDVLPFEVESISSVDFVKRTMEDHFSRDHGFDVALSEILSVRLPGPRLPGMPPLDRYHLRCVGKSDWRRDVPEKPLGKPVELITPDIAAGAEHQPPPRNVVVEAGAYVFVATKTKAETKSGRRREDG